MEGDSAASNQSLQSYIHKLLDVNAEDLKYIEKDLAYYEKVSLIFLLYGSDKINAAYALQRLVIMANNPDHDSDFLREYLRINPTQWKTALLEALSIINANRVLKKMGFHIEDIRINFIPHVPAAALFVHPILKALYIMCENLTHAEAGRLILFINKDDVAHNQLRFYDSKYLEVFLLDWITRSKIIIGDWPQKARSKEPDLNILIQYFKVTENDPLKDLLISSVNALSSPKTQVKVEKPLSNNKTNIKNNTISNDQASYSRQNENDNAIERNQASTEKRESYNFNADERYIIRREFAGFVIIINQKNFHREENPEFMSVLPSEKLRERRGTEKDGASLKATFEKFGYKPYEKQDCSHSDMITHIEEAVKRSAVYDSLIVCILSHGVEGCVYGSNSVPVKIQTIQNILASKTLIGKPKMLIIQACQGSGYQKAEQVSQIESDSPETTAPAFSDMLTAMSTIAGFASFRHIDNGTWFIQTLCKLIDKYGDSKHMLDILTVVNRNITNMRVKANQCMVPVSHQTLNKSFFLPSRN